MKRKIIHIDEEKCNGCGLCIDACHERALELVDGKARLVSDSYCDGLGDCLPVCPTAAIEIVEREADPFDEEAVQWRIATDRRRRTEICRVAGVCPGAQFTVQTESECSGGQQTELRHWPVQLALVNPGADFLRRADLLVAADCTAYAHPGFHSDLMQGRVTLIGCPKLDDAQMYREKLVRMFADAEPRRVTVARMEVPCCSQMVQVVKLAMAEAEMPLTCEEVVITVDGKLRRAV